jgi:rubrerythrin
MNDNLITIATFPYVAEAEACRMHLDDAGIPAFVADAEVVTMDWLLGNAIGYVKLQVPQSRAEEAAAIMARRPRQHQQDVDGPSEATACLACGTQMAEGQDVCPSCGWSFHGEDEH